ncbi:arabinogalactan endo-1,4-beta-galactosidase [Hymenobacter gelipurpurascens]|uniref:Arabinogalactan endo-beta-1,4-galactanase n=1 Tax=Hymenobacter gelipurpurascens TaxID=89968 RepID=A0A212T7S3_9BACT|nr:glycosyl hydrolase 53 family protein [Hymenobacter gelipurpurascens]SNC62082.1 arabinogalactan endo-1,4-beta-galactosidase [Hymenobacter gelipurpurascens]
MQYSFVAQVRTVAFLVLSSGLIMGCGKDSPSVPQPVQEPALAPILYRGVDLSFSPQLEAAGSKFTDAASQPAPTLAIFQQQGANLVRLRLWHTPPDGHSGLPEVVAYAKRVKQAGAKLLLDIHYADSWADPSQQPTPKAWQGLSATVLQDSVYRYTRRVLQVLQKAQASPDLVQIGNEINSGMLWPQGKLNNETSWPAFAALLNSGLSAVADEDPQHTIRTVLHYAGTADAAYFFGHLQQYNVRYDVQGISYYPLYHGRTFEEMEQRLNSLIVQFDKDVLVVETAYPFTLQWKDNTNNIIGDAGQLMPGYAATPEGQRAFLLELRRRVAGLRNKRGIGFCYWAPDWVAASGTTGSSWENQALFDFTNKAQPALEAYKP